MQKKTILHFIHGLTRGGAETMLVRVIKELGAYRNIVVTLDPANHFKGELVCDEFICLEKPSLLSLPASVVQFRKLVKKYEPSIVHSHLPLPNFIARLATPRHIPLVTTIHTSISQAVDYRKFYMRLLDRFTYNYRRSTIIAVSGVAMQDYFSVLKIKPHKALVIYTFVEETLFAPKEKNESGTLMLVSVGALRAGKNYGYLVDAFATLKGRPVELHIYGMGQQQQLLEQQLRDTGANVVLKGEVKNIAAVLPQYDGYVSASKFEGFSLSVLEAMAARLPLLLSNIPSFKEQCKDLALYFDLEHKESFVAGLEELVTNKSKAIERAEQAYGYMKQNYTLDLHVKKIKEVYTEALH
jgi:glycosyltransferase involved in cell wall biosynthesis